MVVISMVASIVLLLAYLVYLSGSEEAVTGVSIALLALSVILLLYIAGVFRVCCQKKNVVVPEAAAPDPNVLRVLKFKNKLIEKAAIAKVLTHSPNHLLTHLTDYSLTHSREHGNPFNV
jgi:hypothetical protein